MLIMVLHCWAQPADRRECWPRADWEGSRENLVGIERVTVDNLQVDN